MAKTIASVSEDVNALEKRVMITEHRVNTLENIIAETNESLVKIADKLSCISEDLAVIKEKEKVEVQPKTVSFQDFVTDLGLYLIKLAILSGLAIYILNKGGF